MEIFLLLLIILVLLVIWLKIYNVYFKKAKALKKPLKIKKSHKSKTLPSLKSQKSTKKKSDFRFTQNNIDLVLYHMSPNDEIGQYVFLYLKPNQSLAKTRTMLFSEKNLKEIINKKISNAKIPFIDPDYNITNNDIKQFIEITDKKDKLDEYISKSLIKDESINDLYKKLLTSNHIKMIISNKLVDLLNNIEKKRTTKFGSIENISEYIKSEVIKSNSKSTITKNLLDSGYTFLDINHAIDDIEKNLKTKDKKEHIGFNEKVSDNSTHKENVKNYIKSRKTADGKYNYAKERLLDVGHNIDYVEKLIKEIESEEKYD